MWCQRAASRVSTAQPMLAGSSQLARLPTVAQLPLRSKTKHARRHACILVPPADPVQAVQAPERQRNPAPCLACLAIAAGQHALIFIDSALSPYSGMAIALSKGFVDQYRASTSSATNQHHNLVPSPSRSLRRGQNGRHWRLATLWRSRGVKTVLDLMGQCSISTSSLAIGPAPATWPHGNGTVEFANRYPLGIFQHILQCSKP